MLARLCWKLVIGSRTPIDVARRILGGHHVLFVTGGPVLAGVLNVQECARESWVAGSPSSNAVDRLTCTGYPTYKHSRYTRLRTARNAARTVRAPPPNSSAQIPETNNASTTSQLAMLLRAHPRRVCTHGEELDDARPTHAYGLPPSTLDVQNHRW